MSENTGRNGKSNIPIPSGNSRKSKEKSYVEIMKKRQDLEISSAPEVYKTPRHKTKLGTSKPNIPEETPKDMEGDKTENVMIDAEPALSNIHSKGDHTSPKSSKTFYHSNSKMDPSQKDLKIFEKEVHILFENPQNHSYERWAHDFSETEIILPSKVEEAKIKFNLQDTDSTIEPKDSKSSPEKFKHSEQPQFELTRGGINDWILQRFEEEDDETETIELITMNLNDGTDSIFSNDSEDEDIPYSHTVIKLDEDGNVLEVIKEEFPQKEKEILSHMDYQIASEFLTNDKIKSQLVNSKSDVWSSSRAQFETTRPEYKSSLEMGTIVVLREKKYKSKGKPDKVCFVGEFEIHNVTGETYGIQITSNESAAAGVYLVSPATACIGPNDCVKIEFKVKNPHFTNLLADGDVFTVRSHRLSRAIDLEDLRIFMRKLYENYPEEGEKYKIRPMVLDAQFITEAEMPEELRTSMDMDTLWKQNLSRSLNGISHELQEAHCIILNLIKEIESFEFFGKRVWMLGTTLFLFYLLVWKIAPLWLTDEIYFDPQHLIGKAEEHFQGAWNLWGNFVQPIICHMKLTMGF